MFRLKICGITNVEDALAVAESGADAVGLNFYEKSARYVDVDTARAIVDALPPEIVKVGLFVNAAEEAIRMAFERFGLDFVQLHGDESVAVAARLAGLPLLKAFRVGQQGLGPVFEYIEQAAEQGCHLQAVLIDAYTKNAYGGTGRLADWDTAAAYVGGREGSCSELPPLILAGGLTAENVSSAIQAVRPAAVDTASGVESSPGKKDPAAIRAFVSAAQAAFAAG